MKLWLVRHAQPLLESGVCYGALDIAADRQATHAAALCLAHVLPLAVELISSTLQRCEQVTQCLCGLRPDLICNFDKRLVEMNFGQWEGQRWDDIARAQLDGWTSDFANWHRGGAECVAEFMARVGAVWDETKASNQPTVWITHAGVIRAANCIAQGRSQMGQASQWPVAAPAWGQWQALQL